LLIRYSTDRQPGVAVHAEIQLNTLASYTEPMSWSASIVCPIKHPEKNTIIVGIYSVKLKPSGPVSVNIRKIYKCQFVMVKFIKMICPARQNEIMTSFQL